MSFMQPRMMRSAVFARVTVAVPSSPNVSAGSPWNYLDITALGRQETWEDSPEGYPQTPPYQWWNYHDVHDAAK